MVRSLFACVALFGFASCHQTMPPPTSPIVVRAPDLARAYRADRSAAELAYTGQRVHVGVRDGITRGSEIHWHLSDKGTPAAVVFRFDADQPKAADSIWIIGTCRGAIRDGALREFSGYDFHILVTDCRLVPPPTTREP